MENLLIALAGALVGGFLSLAGGIITTNRALNGQRELASQAAAEDRAAAAAASSRETAVTLLDQLATMKQHFGSLGATAWATVPHNFRPTGAPDFPAGLLVLRELERLDGSRAQLLPVQISDRWYELVLLLAEYRELLTTEQTDPLWTEGMKGRASTDVQNYMAYVQATLIDYIRNQTVLPDRKPPVLSRHSIDVWRWEVLNS